MTQPGAFVPPPVHYAPPAIAQEYPGATKNDAMLVLIFGILSFFVCQLMAPVAWSKGNTYLQVCAIHGVEPDAMGVIGRIIGIIGTVLLVLTLLLVAGVFLLAALS